MKMVKLFRVVVDGLVCNNLNEFESYQNYPIGYNTEDKYFEWSKSLQKKLKEYTNIKIDWDTEDCEFFEYAEKRLYFCEVSQYAYNRFLKLEKSDREEAINYECDYNWIELQYELLKKNIILTR